MPQYFGTRKCDFSSRRKLWVWVFILLHHKSVARNAISEFIEFIDGSVEMKIEHGKCKKFKPEIVELRKYLNVKYIFCQ